MRRRVTWPDLNRRFGSLYLAAAAYNAGSGQGVPRTHAGCRTRTSERLNSDATFFRLYDTKLLRRETKDYVPKLIAAALIAKEPERYGFTVTPAGAGGLRLDRGPDMTGLDVIARLADTTVAAVRELNPQYLRLATPPGPRSVVRLPAGRGEATTVAAYAVLPPRQRVTFIEHFVARGETLGGIARRYRVSQAMLARGESQGEAAPRPNGPAGDRAHRRRASPPRWRGGWRSRWCAAGTSTSSVPPGAAG